MGDNVERVDRPGGGEGEGGDDEVGEGGDGDVEGEEQPRQRWTRKRACGWEEEEAQIVSIFIHRAPEFPTIGKTGHKAKVTIFPK